MFYRAALQWGKVETDMQPKYGPCCHRRPIFIQSLCELLFLHYSMLVGLSEAVNVDDIERSNVNPLCHSKQKDLPRPYKASVWFGSCDFLCKVVEHFAPAIICESPL